MRVGQPTGKAADRGTAGARAYERAAQRRAEGAVRFVLPPGGWARGFVGARPWHRFEWDGRNKHYVARCRLVRILPGRETYEPGAFRARPGKPICVACRDGKPLKVREAERPKKRETPAVVIHYGSVMAEYLGSPDKKGIYPPKPVPTVPPTAARERK